MYRQFVGTIEIHKKHALLSDSSIVTLCVVLPIILPIYRTITNLQTVLGVLDHSFI